MPSTLLSTPEVARKLRLSIGTVNRMAKDGRLIPATKLPGLRGANVFDSEAVDAYLAAQDAKWAERSA